MKKLLITAALLATMVSSSFASLASGAGTVVEIETYNAKFANGSHPGFVRFKLSDNNYYYINGTDSNLASFLSQLLTAKSKALNVYVWYETTDNYQLNGTTARGVASILIQ